MYTATMIYKFKANDFAGACALWQRHVLESARNQPGFVRMQFLVDSPQAMAIGTWQAKSHAEAFMQTGVFQRLMAELTQFCDSPPIPHIWDLLYFEQA